MGIKATATEDRMAEITRRLEELVAKSCGRVPVGITVRIGRAYRVIHDIVKEQDAELLVLGAHDVSKGRLGTVAAHCARSIPADVLILRDWLGKQASSIAACVDFSLSSAAGLGRAIEIAKAHQASLEIIHVMFPPSRDPWGRLLESQIDDETSYETIVSERTKSRLNGFLEPFIDRLADIKSSSLILEGESPAAAITAHVKAEKIELVVIGSHDDSWLEEFVLGSNAERFMHDSTASYQIAKLL